MANFVPETEPIMLSPGNGQNAQASEKQPLTESTAQPSSKLSAIRKWSAVGISLSGFISSCAFAIGHHIFYSALHNTTVGSTARQEWAVRIGTLFAVLVGTSLCLAISSAYFQYLWHKLKSARVSLAHLDDAFDALSSIFTLVKPKFIKKLPIAALASLICWSTYIMTLFPPATLSTVEQVAPSRINILRPSLMYFDSSKAYPATTSDDALQAYVGSNGISTELKNLFDDVSIDSITLAPIPRLSKTNYSYTASMNIPHIKCEPINADDDLALRPQDIGKALTPILQNRVLRDLDIEVLNMTMYEDYTFTYRLRDVPSSGGRNSSSSGSGWLLYIALARTVDPEEGRSFLSTPVRLPSVELDEATRDRAVLDGSIYIAWLDPSGLRVNMTQCQLYNSSVEVEAVVEARESSISITRVLDMGPPLSQDTALWEPSSNGRSWASLALNAWMQLLYNQIQASAGSLPDLSLEWNSLGMNPDVLARTEEYDWQLRDIKTENARTLTGRPTQRFGDWIEELSLNFSLSLMSDPRFCDEVEVETSFGGTRIVYSYQAKNLVIPYAAGLLASLVIICLGFWSFSQNGTTSYDNKVSTVAAAMRNPEMAETLNQVPVDCTIADAHAKHFEVKLEKHVVHDGNETGSQSMQGYWFVPYLRRNR
ncbi:hypothetical protein BDW02DRAFT_566744 [Decorospora gaudefroyi]|uniref:Uncharacterized protein n=1 Tax=Decorospora gaudefroyi TaxID=184978 RepID=A0A6A5KLJ6_9PLEO|nr:hypothetical protein BDW02DRAFT_566744 [Decorospora gaudefroyi]